MTYWEVQLTLRDERGDRTRESWGIFPLEKLAAALERAFRRAGRESGGVQVIRRSSERANAA